MKDDMIDDIIRALIPFAIEAYEHEDQPDTAVIQNFHFLNVRNLRRAREIIKRLEKVKLERNPFPFNDTKYKRKEPVL